MRFLWSALYHHCWYDDPRQPRVCVQLPRLCGTLYAHVPRESGTLCSRAEGVCPPVVFKKRLHCLPHCQVGRQLRRNKGLASHWVEVLALGMIRQERKRHGEVGVPPWDSMSGGSHTCAAIGRLCRQCRLGMRVEMLLVIEPSTRQTKTKQETDGQKWSSFDPKPSTGPGIGKNLVKPSP